eukprot:TRINITY_DN3286_c0_g1_i2.p1 TRINITY_DN3286_c0_g1~~TRINITY_DN3286_c0_g1_i2.p1  ORF type:complete len:505 (-),score=115.23 TRINITY_DN3286_c0_g1_i2:22-1536(-)
MFSVTPKTDCPHVEPLAAAASALAAALPSTTSCSQCDHRDENWVCVSCRAVNCGRYAREHAAQHNATAGHPIALGWADLSVWCYSCEAYIVSPHLGALLGAASAAKFPAAPAPARATAPATSTPAQPGRIPAEYAGLAAHADLNRFLRERCALYGVPAECLSAVALDGARAAVYGSLPFEHASESVLLRADVAKAFPRLAVAWTVGTESFPAFKARGPARAPSGSRVADMNDVELLEFHDSEAVLDRKIEHLAALLASAKHAVFHTGAGISTSAKIADFRGPNGVWTRRDRKLPPPSSVDFAQAQPTLTHRAIKQLLDRGTIKYLVSQNVDGLHRRSGVAAAQLSELHGNAFREICHQCKKDFLRDFSVSSVRGPHLGQAPVALASSKSGISHLTGRKCDACRTGFLQDSIIHFGEDLPAADLEQAVAHSKRSDLAVCWGTSLRVSPACNLPDYTVANGGPLVVVNLQATPKDDAAVRSGGVVIHAQIDDVMSRLLRRLGQPLP